MTRRNPLPRRNRPRPTRSSRCWPTHGLSVARADLNGAQAKIDQAIAAQPKSVEALLAKAQLLRLKNDGPGAMAVLDDLIATQPSAMQAHLDRASLALAMNKNDLAKADIEAVLKGTPGNVPGDLSRRRDGGAGRPFRCGGQGPGADRRASSAASSGRSICRRW